MKTINIKWDLDGNNVNLPTEIVLPNSIEHDDFDAINNYLSDCTGFLVESYDITDENNPAYKETLERANEALKKYGMEIIVTCSEGMYFNVGVRKNGSENIEWYAENDFNNEVEEDINLTWHLAIGKEEKECYIVSYVTLSGSDYQANGNVENFLFEDKNKAIEKAVELRLQEMAFCDENNREFEVIQGDVDDFRMEWAGGSESIRITVKGIKLVCSF